MSVSAKRRCTALSLIGAMLALGTTGCQIDVGGQTLPSAWWQTDDVQYFPPGAEFKLAREAASLEAMRRDEKARARAGFRMPGPFPGAGAGAPAAVVPPGVVPPPAPGPAVP